MGKKKEASSNGKEIASRKADKSAEAANQIELLEAAEQDLVKAVYLYLEEESPEAAETAANAFRKRPAAAAAAGALVAGVSQNIAFRVLGHGLVTAMQKNN